MFELLPREFLTSKNRDVVRAVGAPNRMAPLSRRAMHSRLPRSLKRGDRLRNCRSDERLQLGRG